MIENRAHNVLNYGKAFAFGIILNVIYIAIEFIYGLIVNSMALIADAGHNLSDVFGLLLAWGASYLARTDPTKRRTYGLQKSTVLAAFFNALILLIAVGGITLEAVRKLFNPEPLSGSVIIFVASVGVVINTLTALLFMKGREQDINIKGAFLHMAADAWVSAGVVAAGVLILLTNWYWIDPVMSLIIAAVITAGTWGLLKESFFLSVDAVPSNIDTENVKSFLKSIDGVKQVHDLHIWGMSTTNIALTAHLLMDDQKTADSDELLEYINKNLREKYHIEHSTIQVEKRCPNPHRDKHSLR